MIQHIEQTDYLFAGFSFSDYSSILWTIIEVRQDTPEFLTSEAQRLTNTFYCI